MYRHLIVFLLGLSLIHADETRLDKKNLTINENQNKNKLPTLEILPAGSVLKNIRIPRYNKDYTNASLLTAEQLEVISADEIKGSNVNIKLYGDNGVEKTQTTLNSVSLNQQTGLITSQENLTFEGDSFAISSQGIALNIEKQCGFLLGKNQTIIYIKESDSMINSKDKAKAKEPSKKIAAIVASTIVSSPALLTAEELAQIDKQAQPSTEEFISQLDKTKETLEATAAAEAKIAEIRKELNEQLQSAPAVKKNQPIPPELVPVKGRENIKITSDQLLFDAKKGIFVYSGNVNITHPKYSFSCDGEVKIILKESAEAKKLSADEKAKLRPNDVFDSIQYIVATKNVVLRAKDNKGKDVTAVTNSLTAQNINVIKTVDKKTKKEKTSVSGDIILRGKGSRLNTADGQLKVTSSKGYIKIDKDLNASGVDIDTDFVVPKN